MIDAVGLKFIDLKCWLRQTPPSMRLETFVDIMGINIIHVIDRIQGVPADRQLCPDDFFNEDWPSKETIARDGKPNEILNNRETSELCKILSKVGELEDLSPRASSQENGALKNSIIFFCNSRKVESNEQNQTFQASNGKEKAKQIESYCHSHETVFSKRATDFTKASSTPIWRRPNSLRLIAFKEFVKNSVRSYSDAEKILSRGANNILKTSRFPEVSEEDKGIELFDELLPLHVTLNNKCFKQHQDPICNV